VFQVVQSLQDADHSVIMLTGDALFTSLHVAREVGICRHRDSATLKCSPSSGPKPVFEWEIRDKQGAPVSPTLPFEPERIASLAAKYNLLATEADFTAAAATCSFDLWKSSQCVLQYICPFRPSVSFCLPPQTFLRIRSHEPARKGQRRQSHPDVEPNHWHSHVR
jgi:magnesium-transporting ATPase (P-type)